MSRIIKPITLTLAVVVIGFLSLRGSVAIYKQLQGAQGQSDTLAAAPPTLMVTKTQRIERAKALLAGMGKEGRVIEVFGANDGTTGVVIKSEGGAFIGWMVDGVDALFVGAKFDVQGNNRTQAEMLARSLAQPSATPPAGNAGGPDRPESRAEQSMARLMGSINQSVGFIEGRSGPIITAYVDPNCTFCTQLWRNLRAPITAGQIRVRWAPVAIIAADSRARAATLLQSSRPIDVMTEHGASGKPIPTSQIDPGTSQAIDANNAMLKLLSGNQAAATPVLVIPTATGEPVITRGLPPNLTELLAQAR